MRVQLKTNAAVSFQASAKLFQVFLTSSPQKYIKVKYLYAAELLLFTLNNLQDFEIFCDLILEKDYILIFIQDSVYDKQHGWDQLSFSNLELKYKL